MKASGQRYENKLYELFVVAGTLRHSTAYRPVFFLIYYVI